MTLWQTLRHYCNPFDGRYEDLKNGRWYLNVFRDFTAGLIVAAVAIPLAMGFAMASGLRPEQGIVGGAVAGLVGALMGGSKYQVYGPTAAFIPVIAGLMAIYGSTPETFKQGHAFLVFASMIAGVFLLILGLARLGRIVALVPHSIVVGFTIGIAVTIALSQIGEAFGLPKKLDSSFFAKIEGIAAQIDYFNVYALILALMTFAVIKFLLRVSIFIPAPLVALLVAVLLSTTIWSDKGLMTIEQRFNPIPTDLLVFTAPALPGWSAKVLFDLAYFVIAILFVSGVESLLCSRMADRLAGNQGTPYNPNKELWGQGWVQILVPLLNGFPHTGALARTATNIKVGAISPLAGIFKFALKLLIAVYLASLLNKVPMACIGGILLFVAVGMVKPAEVKQVLGHNRFHVGMMVYTAVMVVITDFLIGVLSAIIIYVVLYKFLDAPAQASTAASAEGQAAIEPVSLSGEAKG